MTTIACDGKSMAGDGLVTSNGTAFGFGFPKVKRLADGRIAGFCGTAYDGAAFWNWLEDGGDVPDFDKERFEGLVLAPDGNVRSYDARGRSIEEEAPVASGSGRELALGAMLHGANPKQAVEIAALRDLGTGGKILHISLSSEGGD